MDFLKSLLLFIVSSNSSFDTNGHHRSGKTVRLLFFFTPFRIEFPEMYKVRVHSTDVLPIISLRKIINNNILM
jgi:hypothetical protein